MSPKLKSLFSNIRYDLPASIVVFFVALPLCLGIALASGAPLFSGIIAGIVGGIVVGILSNSALGVSGPAAGLTVIVLNSIETLGVYEAFLLAVVLAGIFQIVLGVLKAGVIGYYFPSAVIKGMLAAIGIIIILKQIPHGFGYDMDYEGDLDFSQADGRNTFTELLAMMDGITPGAVAVFLIALFILLLWDHRLVRKNGILHLLPGSLVAVTSGALFQFLASRYFPFFALESVHLVNVPIAGNLGQFFSQFTTPDFSFIFQSEVWIVALTIAIVASLESLLSVEATDKLDPKKRFTDTNRELIAQGTGNMVSGLIGGLPVTQVIVRSSANIQSGGKTKMSAILHGFFLLASVVAFPSIINMIPLAALAAILIMVGYKLANIGLFKEVYKLGFSQFLPFAATILGVVFTDLLIGIGIGIGVAILVLLRNSFKNAFFLHMTKSNGDVKHIHMSLAEEVYFMNKGAIINVLNSIQPGSKLIIDMSGSVNIDYDVLEIIQNFQAQAISKNIQVEIIPFEKKTRRKQALGVDK